jgi:hypothetical protein
MDEQIKNASYRKCNTELIKFICCVLASNNRAYCKYFIKEFNDCIKNFK